MEQREALRLALVERAKEARKNSYCPYSGFAVGAALLGSAINRALQPRLSIAQLCWLAS